MELTDELRELVLTGVHNVMCTPRVVCPKRPGRFNYVRAERPARGSADCLCKDRRITYNGEVVHDGHVHGEGWVRGR